MSRTRFPVQVRFAKEKDGDVHVHTGIWVFNTTTIEQLYKLAMMDAESPDWVEIGIGDYRMEMEKNEQEYAEEEEKEESE